MKDAAIAAIALLFSAAALQAGAIPPDKVQFGDLGKVDEALSDVEPDAKKGQEIFIARKLGNCLACHANSDLAEEPFHGEVGPPLDGAGDRWSEAQLRGILVNSKNVFPDTVMPAFYVNSGFTRVHPDFKGETILTADQVEHVIAYLKTLKEQ